MDYKKKYLKYKLKYLTVKKLYGGSNYDINPIEKEQRIKEERARRVTQPAQIEFLSKPHDHPLPTLVPVDSDGKWWWTLNRPRYHRRRDTEDFMPYPAPVIPRIIPNEEGEELLPPALPAPQEQSAFNHSNTSPFFAPQEQSALPTPQEQSALPAPTPVGERRLLTDEERKYFGLSKAIKKQPKSKKLKVKQPEAKQVVAVLAETNNESNEASVFEPPTPIMDKWAREAGVAPAREAELTQAADQDLIQWERQVLAPEEQDEIEQGDDEEIQLPPEPGIIKYPGVLQLRSGRWGARIGQEYLGTYDTAEEATAHYRAEKKKITRDARAEKKKLTRAAHTLLNFAKEAQQGIEVSGPSAASADIPDLGPIDLERYRTSNKTGYMGVSKNKGPPTKKYRANIIKDGFNTNLGTYPTAKQAAKAYAKQYRQIWGQDPT